MSDSEAAKPAADSPRRGSLLVIFLTVFIDLLGFGMVLPLLPLYARQFTLDASGWQLGLLMGSFSAMQFLFAPLWGRLSDRIGRRPVLMIGLASSAVCYFLFGVATVMESFTGLLLARIGAGIAGATISTAQAYIADSTSLTERPRGMALIGMAFGLGFTFGPLLGLLAVPSRDQPPGPWPGYVAAILSAAALLLAAFKLPESRQRQSSHAAGWTHLTHLGRALSMPSVGLLLIAVFVLMFSFSNLETTMSLLIKSADADRAANGPPVFQFSWAQVCLTYTFIGLTLALVQGGLVRRLAGRVAEGSLATGGAIAQTIGFGTMILAIQQASVPLLFVAVAVITSGFSFMQPSLNSLLSRRSDPAQQGLVLGVGQSVNALARIFGSVLSVPLFMQGRHLPYTVGAGLMALGALLVWWASRRGRDYAPEA